MICFCSAPTCSSTHTPHTLSPRTHIKIKACISLQASVLEAEAADGDNRHIQHDAHTLTDTHMHTKTSQTLQKKKKHEAVRTHTHTLAFPVPVQLTRLKKKHKNKLHKYFLPSLFHRPLPVSRVFCKFLSRFCRRILVPHVLSGAASHLTSASKLEGQKVIESPPSRSSQRPPSLAPLVGPLHENIRWDVGP